MRSILRRFSNISLAGWGLTGLALLSVLLLGIVSYVASFVVLGAAAIASLTLRQEPWRWKWVRHGAGVLWKWRWYAAACLALILFCGVGLVAVFLAPGAGQNTELTNYRIDIQPVLGIAHAFQVRETGQLSFPGAESGSTCSFQPL